MVAPSFHYSEVTMTVNTFINADTDFGESSKFRTERGGWITQSLFLEALYDHDLAIYSLWDIDRNIGGKPYPSIKKLYLEMEDLMEYEFANKYFGGWEHWKRISEGRWFSKHIKAWRNELELKLRAREFQNIIKSTKKPNFVASKWILDGGWKGVRGRPSKEEAEKREKLVEIFENETNEDSARIFSLIPKKVA
jgi:hypothetical protein